MALDAQIDQHARDFITRDHRMLIGGDWVEAASGQTFETFDPATGDVLATVPRGSSEDIDRAVKTARAAFDPDGPWRRMSPSERGRAIHRLGDLILEHGDEFATLETLDNGKPLTIARAADVPLAADLFHYMSGWTTKSGGSTLQISVPYMPGAEWHAYTLHEPVGVVGQIIPWNFPLLMAAWKLGPALATGCTVILKPAEQTPLTRAAPRRAGPGGRHPARRRQRRHGLRRGDRRAAGRPPRRRQDRLHRLHRGRQADPRRRRGQPQEGVAGARRQVPQHRLRRRRPRDGDPRRRQRDLLQPRPVLRGRVAAVRRAVDLRRGRRRRRRPRQVDQASAPGWTPTRRWARWSPRSSWTASCGYPGLGSRPRAPRRSPAASATATAATSWSRRCSRAPTRR